MPAAHPTSRQPSRIPPVTLILARLGTYRYVGHRDLARTIARILRRSGLPLALTQGFRPIPRMVLPEPLPVGVASEAERWVVHLGEPRTPDEVRAQVEHLLPAGLDLIEVLAGDCREALDVRLCLSLRSAHPQALSEALAQADLAPDVGLLEVVVRSVGEGEVEIELRPPAGRRASVGRFLRSLGDRAGGREGWVGSVLRRRPLK